MNYPHTIAAGLLGVAQQYPVTVAFSLVDHVYALALRYARVYALGTDFAEDVSQSFGTRWLSDLRDNKRWAVRCLESEPYLRSCARNYVKHAVVAAQRQYHREAGLPEYPDAESAECVENSHRCRRTIADPIIRKELRALLSEAVNRLQPRPREVFNRRHIYNESVTSIAESLGCTQNAVSVSLSASRKQIAGNLIKAGHTEADVRDYLYEMLRED